MAGLQVSLHFFPLYLLVLYSDFDYLVITLSYTSCHYLVLPSVLGGSHGVPRVHYKGRQGDYYIMVCVLQFNGVILIICFKLQLFPISFRTAEFF